MKQKYDIRFNPKRLTGQQIAQHKDFDGLLKKFQQAPSPKTGLVRKLVFIASAIAIAATIAGVVFYAPFQSEAAGDYQAKSAAYFNSKPFIDRPLENVKPQFASYQVNGTKGGVYEYPSGSKLLVPAAAFVDEKGAQLSGEVTLHYREMHDFVDFFIAGIPMTYDSAGTVYNLESAGMVEIFAEQNGRQVRMAPGKSIDVELVSNVNVPPTLEIPKGYNIYKLNESTRNWEYQVVDRMQALDEGTSTNLAESETDSPFYPAEKKLKDKMVAIEVSMATAIAEIEKTIPKQKEPVKPLQATNKDYVFDLDFEDLATDKNDPNAAELAQLYKKYEKMLWQLSPNADLTPEQLQREFGQVSGLAIKRINARDYELTLQKGTKSVQVLINPVLSGDDYAAAMAEFNRDFDLWKAANNERESKLAAAKADALNKAAAERRLAQLDFDTQIEELRKKGLDYAANQAIIKRKVVNRFTAPSFGIWNVDRPLPPNILRMAVNLKDANGKLFENTTGYLVDKSRNTVYTFLATENTDLRFNSNSENLLWVVTEGNKIAILRPEQFKALKKDQQNADLVLETIDKEIKNEADIREILFL